MNLREIFPDLFGSTVTAFVLSTVVAVTSEIPFLLPFGVFIFCGPITALACEAILSCNPDYLEMKEGGRSWIGLIAFLVVSVIGSAVVSRFSGLGFWESFAYTSMIVAVAQAVNGIIIEIEDNSPGGWLNPGNRKRD